MPDEDSLKKETPPGSGGVPQVPQGTLSARRKTYCAGLIVKRGAMEISPPLGTAPTRMMKYP